MVMMVVMRVMDGDVAEMVVMVVVMMSSDSCLC